MSARLAGFAADTMNAGHLEVFPAQLVVKDSSNIEVRINPRSPYGYGTSTVGRSKPPNGNPAVGSRTWGYRKNDWSAGTQGLRFRQFRLFQKGRFGALSTCHAGPFQPENGFRY
jgi:hypothetical protein